MHQNWDQLSAGLQYGPPVAKARRRSCDFVDKGFLDFLDNVQLPEPSPPPQQQSSYDLPYTLGAAGQNTVYNDGPFMSQQHTFHWVPTPGVSQPLPGTDAAPGPSTGVTESVGHKHKRFEDSITEARQSCAEYDLGYSKEQLSGEHSGSDFEDNRKLTKAGRTARMREKNKSAQKRWRDRQKVWGIVDCLLAC